MGNLFMRMLVGALAALTAWAIVEPTNPGLTNQAEWQAFERHLILAWGALIGLAVGGFNGWMQGSRARLGLGLGLGLVLGSIGAPLGYGIGGSLQTKLFGNLMNIEVNGNLLMLIAARFVGIVPLGIFLGAAIGASSFDWRRVIHGAIGGAIGAGIGAFIFDTVGSIFASASAGAIAEGAVNGQMVEVGQVPRAVLSLCMGGMIALFIGLVEQIARQAWVRQALGRNEGREWPLYAPRTLIGRNELSQIPIFGDPAVTPVHAFIDRRGNEYWLTDGGSGGATYLNGQPVSTAPLQAGAHIQVGNTVLQFLLRGGPRNPGYNAYGGAPPGAAPQIPMQPMPTGYPQAPMPQPSQPTTVMQAPTVPTLVAVDGPLVGQRFPVTAPLEIGRETSGLQLAFDSGVSRRHANLAPGPMGLQLTDLGSTNGTFVNGQRVASATIKPGDLVRIGATTFRVE